MLWGRLQGRRKMKKVRGALRAMKTQLLSGGPATRVPPPNFFLFLASSNMFFYTFEVSFTIIIGLRHVQDCKPLKRVFTSGLKDHF